MSHPPGASYPISNALIVAKRALLRLEPPVGIEFSKSWGQGNPLFEWYQRRGTSPSIQTIQLRKERKSPFFHEYIVFSLRNNGGYFRIDRRQQPDEDVPLDSIYTYGVEPFDTIEEVSSLEDRLYASSDCLVEIEFKPNVQVHLALLLKVCQAIRHHKGSRVYTLQRYNCYFFAQTILLCTACAASNWDGMGPGELVNAPESRGSYWKTPNSSDFGPLPEPEATPATGNKAQEQFSDPAWSLNTKFEHDWRHLSLLASKVIQTSPFLTHADDCTHCRESQSLYRQRSLSSEIDRLKDALTTHWDEVFHTFLDRVRAQNHFAIIESGIWELQVEDQSEEEYKRLMASESNRIESEWRDYHQKRLATLTATLRDLLEPTEVCDAWDPHPDVWKAIWASNIGAPFQRVVKEWEEEMATYFASAFSSVQDSLHTQTKGACKKAHDATIKTRVDSFGQRMVIKVNLVMRDNLVVKINSAVPELEQKELEELVSEENNTPLIQRVRGTVDRWSKKAKYGDLMEASSITDMHDLLNNLIHAHSIRVEQYKFWLKCTSAEVKDDIQTTMNDIWKTITNM